MLSWLSLCPGGNCSSGLVGFFFSIRYNCLRLPRWESTAKPPALNLKWHEVSSGCGRSHYTTSSYSVNFFSKGLSRMLCRQGLSVPAGQFALIHQNYSRSWFLWLINMNQTGVKANIWFVHFNKEVFPVPKSMHGCLWLLPCYQLFFDLQWHNPCTRTVAFIKLVWKGVDNINHCIILWHLCKVKLKVVNPGHV